MAPYRFGLSGTGRSRLMLWVTAFILVIAWSETVAWHVTAQIIAAAGASLEALPCWFNADITRQTDCFLVIVPLDWTDPDSAMQHLPVVIFHATRNSPSSDPIVFLNGGPGQRAYIEQAEDITGWAQWLESNPWTHGQDFIVPTQRGTNWTDSSLHCAALGDPRVYAGASDNSGGATDWHGNRKRAARDCGDQMVDAGIPIAAFTTKQNATDMAAL